MDKIPSVEVPSGDIVRQFLFSPAAVITLLGLWIAKHVVKAIYNISPFHPLSRFPGPKIVAATYAYEAYYDWIMGGRYGKRIAAMHGKYGMYSPSHEAQHGHQSPNCLSQTTQLFQVHD